MGLFAKGNHPMLYDLVVIGNSSAADDASIAAATLNQRVALVDQSLCGPEGNASHCRVASSKTIREAIRQMTRVGELDVFNPGDRQARRLTMLEIKRQAARLVDDERKVIRNQFEQKSVDVYKGAARFVRPHVVVVETSSGTLPLEADHVLVASGARILRPSNIPFDGSRIFA